MPMYYLDLALRSLLRNAALTALTIVAVAVGIGASMTVFTLFRALAADPIPDKSSQLHLVLIDNWGPNAVVPEHARLAVSYTDASSLLRARRATAQAGMYPVKATVAPPDPAAVPISVKGHAASVDFFRMFNVPFRSGRAWTRAEEENNANVVVLSAKVADRLFPGQEAVGKELILNRQSWRVIGVLRPWNPQPHFYDVAFTHEDDVLLPFQSAVTASVSPEMLSCNSPPASATFAAQLASECQWVTFWVELTSADSAKAFRQFLDAYMAEQQRIGRFRWPGKYHLYSVTEWLAKRKVVPDEVRLATLVAFGFLLVCLLNAISLLLAKFAGRAGSLSVHRALGASRFDVFAQCLTETALVGMAGGLLGLALMLFGLKIERLILSERLADLVRLDSGMVVITLSISILATVACGAYPSWRASRLAPALQLKVQ